MNRLYFSFLLLCLTGCQRCGVRPTEVLDHRLISLGKETRQAITVLPDSQSGRSAATIQMYERHGSTWRKLGGVIAGVVGRNGIAPPGEKREGDGRTPPGIFTLERGFGYAPLKTKIPYFVLTPDMTWIDDPASPRYNMLSTQAQAAGFSHEDMRRDDILYRHGFVIEYNTKPIVAGAGSAIFFHIWPGPGSSTAGCVATDERNVVRILKWLDPAQKPVIIIEGIL